MIGEWGCKWLLQGGCRREHMYSINFSHPDRHRKAKLNMQNDMEMVDAAPLSSISSISSSTVDLNLGNVCVAIRFRPTSSIYTDEAEADIAFNETAGMIGVTPPKVRRREMFAFSSVHVRESNEAIFEAYGMPLCNSVLGGYNGALLTYGQTGSGKTFTMGETARIGSLEEGMSHRMVRQLFSAIAADSGRSYEISMLYVQVYCERIYDLLIEKQPEVDSNPRFAVPSTSSPAQPRSPRPPAPARREPDSFGSPSKREDNSLSVREDKKNGVFVQGATTSRVSSAVEALALMERASAQLVFASTKLNQHSSRSHSLCTILVKRTDRTQRGTAGDQEGGPPKSDVHAKLVLVDLAGSEDVSRSGVTGQGLAEAQKINRSLLALGNVIHALTRAEGGKKIGSATTHVPFRSSVLTRLLSDSIGGNCRTTLICCCSPASADVSETLSTLRFGCRAKLVRFDSTVNATLPANLLSNLLPSQTGYIKYMRQVKTDTITQTELNKLRDLPWNSTCFDCTALEPAWVALPHGVFICVDCAQTHRNMGQHVSQTKAINTSTHLWSPAELAVVHEVGNAVAAVAYANFALPPKPSWAATPAAKMAYSQEKYGRGSPDFKAAAEQLHAQPALWIHLARAAEAQIAEAKVKLKAIAQDEACADEACNDEACEDEACEDEACEDEVWAAQAAAKPEAEAEAEPEVMIHAAVATQAADAEMAATAESGSREEQEALGCEMALAEKSKAEQEAAGERGEVSDEAREATASRATILQQQPPTPTKQPQPPQPSQAPPWQQQQTHKDGSPKEAVHVSIAAAELWVVSASARVVEAQQVAEGPVAVKAADTAQTAKAAAVEAAKAEVAKAAEAAEAAKAEDAEVAKKKMYEDDDDEFDLWGAPLSASPALKKTASFSKKAAAEKAAAEDALVASMKARAVAQKAEAVIAAAKAAEAQAAKVAEVEAAEVAPLPISPPALTPAAAEQKGYKAIIPNKAIDHPIIRRLEPHEEVALYAVMQQAVGEAEEEVEEQVEAEAEDEALEKEVEEEASGSATDSPLGASASGCRSAAASGYASEASSPPSSSTFISTISRPDVFLSLEAGLEELAKVCTKAGTKRDSIIVLAEHLKRNNPRHSPAAEQKLAYMRAEAARLAAEKAAMASSSAGGREKFSEKPPRPVRPQHVATGIGNPDVGIAFTTQKVPDDSTAAPLTIPQPSQDELLDEMPSASTLLMPHQDDDQHSLSEFLTTTWKLNILESLRRESIAEPSAGSDGGDAGKDASVATSETTSHGGLQSPRSPRSPKTVPRLSPAAAEPDASAAVAEPGTAERLLQPSASGREKPPRPARLSAATDASVAFTAHSLGAGNRSPPPRAGRLYAVTGFGEPNAGVAITTRSTPGATSAAESAAVFESTPLRHGRPYMGEAATGFGAALEEADADSKRSTSPAHVDPLKAFLENTGQFFKKSGDEIGKAFNPDSPGRRKPRESCLY